jgi:hypothetical protein
MIYKNPIIHAAIAVTLALVACLSASHAQGLYPETSTRVLTVEDVDGKSKMQLKIMRNEVYARYGYIFKAKDMNAYFTAQQWYRPMTTDVSSLVTPLEKQNIALIEQFEVNAPARVSTRDRKRTIPNTVTEPVVTPEPTNDDSDESTSTVPGIYPQGSERNLNDADLVNMSAYELLIMRNEIFARHGYIFKTEEMRNYFQQMSWYSPVSTDVGHLLSPIERSNIKLIQKYERLNK